MGISINTLKNPAAASLAMVILAGGILGGLQYKNSLKPKAGNYFGDTVYELCFNTFCAKQDNGWIITEKDKKYPGDKDKLDQLAQQMAQIKLTTVASVNKDKFTELGFADNSLVLKSRDKQLEVGNMSSDYESTYVKVGETVYRIPFVWNNTVYGDAGYWKNRIVTNLPLYQVSKITVNKNGKTSVIEKKDNKWPDDKYVEKAAHLTATDIIEAPKEGSTEVSTITVETDDKKSTIFSLGQWNKNRKETVNWAKTDKGDYYIISKDDFVLLTR